MTSSVQLLAQPGPWQQLQYLQSELGEAATDPTTWPKLGQALRQAGHDPELVVALVSQLQLRAEARGKFGESAQHMLFTRAGLEQATRFQVSLLHALRYANAGVKRVADLGCGIGSDALALATTGLEVLAVDRDPEALAAAAVNLREFPKTQVLEADVMTMPRPEVDGVFLDPARRSHDRRLFRPEQWSPPWDKVTEIFSWGLATGVKLAPGIDHHYLGIGSHAQWLSYDGALVEASLWSTQLAPEGPGRSALVYHHHTIDVLSEECAPDAPLTPAPVGALEQYLFEPDPAVIRAGLLARLADLTGTHLVHPKIAYLSGPSPTDSPYWTGFEVLAEVALRPKVVKRQLRELGAGPVEVKKRGADVDPAQLQKQWQQKAGIPVVVFATRVGSSHRAIIARRLKGA